MLHIQCMRYRFAIESTIVLAMTAVSHSQFIRYVDDDAPTSTGNGQSWSTAHKHLQDGLANAASILADPTTPPGSTVQLWLAAGVYRPDQGAGIMPGDREASFAMASRVQVYGGFAGNEPPGPDGLKLRRHLVNLTILSGDLEMDDEPDFVNYQDNSYHVVTAPPNVGNDGLALLDGFIITAGNADGDPGQIDHSNRGGGIFVFSSHPVIVRCTFTDNRATLGGGGASLIQSSGMPEFFNCQFLNNQAGNSASRDASNWPCGA